MPGPLQGLKVLEMGGSQACSFAGMMLADMGAEAIRIRRPNRETAGVSQFDVLARGRHMFALDLRQPNGAAALRDLIGHAEILIEGYRPGVMENLGFGPDVCMQHSSRLVYGRLTGWGQTGPLSTASGREINYIAISGALHAIGSFGEPPTVPLRYVGGFGGGGMLLAFGVLCALHEVRASGRGQVVDAAISDGAALLSAMFYGLNAQGTWSTSRGENLLDGGAHFYRTYECADGQFIAVGALDTRSFEMLLHLCGVEDPIFNDSSDPRLWPVLGNRLADIFRTRTRAEWTDLLEGTNASVSPVLDWKDAPLHAHNLARETFIAIDGVVQPAPQPRFNRTPAAKPQRKPITAEGVDETLRRWGVREEVRAFLVTRAVA